MLLSVFLTIYQKHFVPVHHLLEFKSSFSLHSLFTCNVWWKTTTFFQQLQQYSGKKCKFDLHICNYSRGKEKKYEATLCFGGVSKLFACFSVDLLLGPTK